MTSIGKESGVFGLGVYGLKVYGEPYAPLVSTETESVGISDLKSTEIGFSYTESTSLSEIISEIIENVVSENLSITHLSSYTLEVIPLDSLLIPEVNSTTIGYTVVEDLSNFEEVGGEAYVLEFLTIDEIVLCTLTCSLSEDAVFVDTNSTEIYEPTTDSIGFTESVANEYGLSVTEFLTIIETITATIPHQYKRVEIKCPLSIPKTLRLHCKIRY